MSCHDRHLGMFIFQNCILTVSVHFRTLISAYIDIILYYTVQIIFPVHVFLTACFGLFPEQISAAQLT